MVKKVSKRQRLFNKYLTRQLTTLTIHIVRCLRGAYIKRWQQNLPFP